ncbi:excinuclease ABC subunit B [Flavobacterium sp. RSSA_27]|uniref:excinuclease ABC subunit B n=1 Tax=Flavobacterium sp. RSSA_27 TaxID=3447667 RepID=UPI003F413BAD
MNSFEEKRSLLLEMISFSVIDGKLHEREFNFISAIGKQLGFSKEQFADLFHQELPQLPIKSEFQRIQQFYRLALIMHCDGILHQKEAVAIHQIAIDMGLNPGATKRVLQMMQDSPNAMIDAKVLLAMFQEQHN